MEKQKPCHAARDCAIPPRPEEMGFPAQMMKRAVELGVFPKHDFMDHVAENHSKIEGILMAAQEEGEA